MNRSDKLEDCKKEIRSILISYQRGCMLSEFNKAYRDMIGRRLPIKEFGFYADIEFLYSIPDVVKITPTRTGEYHLAAVADEKSKHIQKLVARQKPSKMKLPVRTFRNSRLNPVLPPRFAASARKREEIVFSEPKVKPKLELKLPPKTVSNDQTPLSNYEPNTFKPQTLSNYEPNTFKPQTPSNYEPILPPKVSPKEEVIALVQHFGNRIVFDDLLFEYQKMYQKELLLSKYGFSSLEDCINDIPELYIEKRNKCYVVYDPEYIHDIGESYQIQDTSLSSIDEEIHQNNAQELEERSPEVSSPYVSESNNDQNSDQVYESSSLRMKLVMVARKYSNGILSSAFPSCFEEVTGVTLDLYRLGYQCLSDLIDDFPDIFSRETMVGSRKDFIIYSVKEPRSEINGIKVIHHIIINLRRILQAYPEGITLQDFLHIYSINCNDTLCIKDFGFDDLETFLLDIKNQVPLEINSSNGIKTVYIIQDGNSSSHKEIGTSPKEIPLDAAHPKYQFKRQTLPDNFDFSKYFPVYTSSVAHPGQLYIQLQGEETTDSLVKLATSMEAFYGGSKSELYTMQNCDIKVGASCVALWPTDGHWYRAVIIAVVDMKTVQVNYVDYGTKDKISKALLRYIKKEFAVLPAQAIRCRLAFLKPPKNATKWSHTCLKRILSLCEDISLMAKIEEVGPDGIYSILLCDTNGEEDVYINDVLSNEGLADYDVGNNGSDSCIASPTEPVNQYPSLNPLLALQAQYYLQAFVTVAPCFANNENYIKLLREVTLCCSNPEQEKQSIGMSSTTVLTPPGFSTVPKNAYSYVKPPVPPNTVYTPLPVSDSNPGMESRFAVPHASTHVASSTESDTFMSLKSCETSEGNGETGEIFVDDDDDEIFQEFCQKVSLSRMRHVKRVLLGEGYKIHIIVVESQPYASSGDISQLIWSNKEADHLFRRLQLKDVDIPSITVSEFGNEELFRQLEKFSVKGIERMSGCKGSILLYPLRVVIKILNIFGHPSVTLRTKLTEEIASFDPDDRDWTHYDSPEPVEVKEENLSSVTDDDKIEKLCLFDLLAMKESVICRRKRLMNNNAGKNVKNDELEKLDQLLQKVLHRIQEIKEICSVFA